MNAELHRVVNAAIANGNLVFVNVPPRKQTLAEACRIRGIDPERTEYRTPQQRFRAVDRIIPGVADSKPPCDLASKYLGANYHGNARKMYAKQQAQRDAEDIRRGHATYVEKFLLLNHLT